MFFSLFGRLKHNPQQMGNMKPFTTGNIVSGAACCGI